MSKQRCGLCRFWERTREFGPRFGTCFGPTPDSVPRSSMWPMNDGEGYECPCFKPLKPKAKERKTGKKG
jgi:hypothetical protein